MKSALPKSCSFPKTRRWQSLPKHRAWSFTSRRFPGKDCSAQVREALALPRMTGGATIVKLRAFVAGSGDTACTSYRQ
jgi:hypothetical protein